MAEEKKRPLTEEYQFPVEKRDYYPLKGEQTPPDIPPGINPPKKKS